MSAAHALQAAASGAWPGTQRQSLTLLAAGAEVLALGPQAAQALLLAALKRPCAHGWQGPPGAPEKPARQRQDAMPDAPGAESALAGHGRHASPSSYVPAAHSAHGPPGGPPKPAAQRQAVTFAEDGSEVEFPGQAAHSAEPELDLYVATGQAVQFGEASKRHSAVKPGS